MLAHWYMADSKHRDQVSPAPGDAVPGKPNGKNIDTVDPTGFRISLSVQTWEGHIILGHPELKDLLDIVTQTLHEPEIVLESPSQTGIFMYYRLTGRSVLRRNDLFMAVVVKRDEQAKTGIVKTAYVTKQIKKEGGKLVWLKRV